MPHRHPSRRTVLIAAAAATGLTLTSCSGGQTSPSSTAAAGAASGQPVQGGSFTFADIELQTDYQTQKAFNYTQANVFRQIADRLTDLDPDSGEVVPWVATEWTVNDSATEIVFTVRPGVTFSDGTPLDAAAVKANLDQLGLGDQGRGIIKNRDFIGYASSEVVGTDQVKVVLSEPNALFVRATSAATSSLLAPSTLALDYEGQADVTKIVASGPFTVASVVPDQELRLVKRADYAWPSSLS